MYKPDYWYVIKINDSLDKVFATWGGTYLTGPSWRLNSGITSVEEDENYFYFHGSSGSIYKCHKDRRGCHPAWTHLLEQFIGVANEH